MKKYIIILIALVWSLSAQGQCGIIDTSFCPGNFFQNGDFETVSNTPGGPDCCSNNINIASGWGAMWTGQALADLSCGGTSLNRWAATPIPNTGVYAGMWIINSTSNNPEREGMYNRLSTPIAKSTGSYTFNFDIAMGINSTNSATIGFYGVYNPTNGLGNKIDLHNPTNLNLFNNVSGAQVVHLGSVATPQPFTSTWSNQSLTFNSDLLPTNGITHILITPDDLVTSPYSKIFVNFDNFCLAPAVPEEPIINFNCCETPLGIANVPNTPSPLPIRQVTEGETTFSVASETFQIHENQPIPITEIRVSVIDLIYKYNYESCGDCVNNPALWGSLMSQSVIGEKGLYPTAQDYTTSNMVNANQNVRELVWTNPDGALLKPGDKFDVNYILPPASDIPCCVTEVQVCTQISWKDANCCYNDIKTCSTIKLESEQNPDPGPSSTCECGEQSPIVTISSNNTLGNTPSSVKCGDEVNLKLFKSFFRSGKIRYSFDHPGNGVCKPKSCNSGEFWTITGKGGRLIRQGTGNINHFLFPSTGTYNFEFTPSCGGNDCKPCEFKVNVRR